MYRPNIVKITICDDHRIFTDGLRLIIENEDGYKVTGQFNSGNNLLDKINQIEIDILLLDINLGDRNGLDLVKHIKQLRPEIKIIMISMYDDISFVQRALQAGADGYLHKSESKNEIYKALNTVLEDRYYINDKQQQLILKASIENKANNTSLHDKLSNRELEVLILLGKGATNNEIGANLHLSPKTIGTYKQRLLKKLHIERTVQLFEYVKEHDLI